MSWNSYCRIFAVVPICIVLLIVGRAVIEHRHEESAKTSSATRLSNTVSYWIAVGQPPEATSTDFMLWLDALISYRDQEIPVDQPTVYYFAANGNDDNDGMTPASPKVSLKFAQNIIDSAPNPANVRIRFRRGDTWFTDRGLRLTKQSIVIDAYGKSPEKPVFNRFVWQLDHGWQPVAGQPGVYQLAQVKQFGWIYDENAGWEQPFLRTSSIGGLQTVPADCAGSFYYDLDEASLYVNANGVDPNTMSLRGVHANNSIGCNVDAHGCRVEDIVFIGFGLDPSSTSNQSAGIKVTAFGDAATVIKGCESYYCSSHAMHFNSGHFTTSQGVATFIECSAGFCQSNGVAGETIFNSYVFGGDQETIFTQCEARYGTLPDDSWYVEGQREVRGQACFSHTASFPARLMICDRLSVPDVPFGCARPTRFTDVPTANQLADARALIVEEDFRQSRPGAQVDIGTSNGVRINGVYQAKMANEPYRAWTNGTQAHGWVANCHFDIDSTMISNGFVALYNGRSNHAIKVEHCDFVFRVAKNHKVRIPDYDGNSSLQTQWHNCIFAVVGDPISIAVGVGNPVMDNNGYYNTDGSFGGDPNSILISDPAELAETFVPVAGSSSYATGTAPLFTVDLDRVSTPRSPPPSLGDREHTN